jgi:transposase-like protein
MKERQQKIDKLLLEYMLLGFLSSIRAHSHLRGVFVAEVAAKLQVTRTSVYCKLRALRNGDLDLTLNRALDNALLIHKKHRQIFYRAIELREAGRPVNEIAGETGVKPSTLYQWFAKRGIFHRSILKDGCRGVNV